MAQSKFDPEIVMARPQREVAYRRKSAEQRKQDLINAGIACLGKGGISAFTIDYFERRDLFDSLYNRHQATFLFYVLMKSERASVQIMIELIPR